MAAPVGRGCRVSPGHHALTTMSAADPANVAGVTSFVDLMARNGVAVVISAVVVMFAVAFGWLWLKKLNASWFPARTLTPTVGESTSTRRVAIRRAQGDRTVDPIGPDDESTADGHSRRKATDSYTKGVAMSDHYFFGNVEQLSGTGMLRIRCGCPGRTALLRRMLTIYLSAWKEETHSLVLAQESSAEFDDGSIEHAAKLEKEVNACLLRITAKFHEGWKRESIPLPAVNAFDRWHTRVMDIQIDHTRNLARGTFFGSNRVRLAAILCQHTTVLAILIAEAGTVLRRLNGDLTGVVFDGITIAAIDGHDADDDESNHVPLTPVEIAALSSKHRAVKPKKHRSGEYKETT